MVGCISGGECVIQGVSPAIHHYRMHILVKHFCGKSRQIFQIPVFI